MAPGLGQQQPPSTGRLHPSSAQPSMPESSRSLQTQGNKRKRDTGHPGIGVRIQPPAKCPNQSQPSHPAPSSRTQAARTTHARPQTKRGAPPLNLADRSQVTSAVKSRSGMQGGRSPHVHAAHTGPVRSGSGNRLGQRARRALAEKMHGSQAKHIKPEPARSHGALLKDASAAGGRHKNRTSTNTVKRQSAVKADRSSLQNHDRAAAVDVNKPRWEPTQAVLRGVVDESHPSWVAKRQQKARLRLKPTGRKTVFGDGGGKADISGGFTAPQLAPPTLTAEDWAGQSSQGGHAAFDQAIRAVDGDKVRGRGKSWGDAGRGTVEELLPAAPVEQARGRDQLDSLGQEVKPGDGRVGNDSAVKMKGVHPSWVAAKQRKAQLAKLQQMSKNSSGGNKIKFDD